VRRSLFLLLLLTCCLPACAGFLAYDVDFENADRFFNEKKYSDAITAYDKIAKDSPRSERGSRALYDVAFTHAFYDNPHKDYAQALQEFDEFLRIYPNSERTRDAQNWRHVLRMVLELRKENEHLLQSINELKQIDIRHEERRRK
jgi:outer membrane protein assembly factor BamD (BamD/ComL family)